MMIVPVAGVEVGPGVGVGDEVGPGEVVGVEVGPGMAVGVEVGPGVLVGDEVDLGVTVGVGDDALLPPPHPAFKRISAHPRSLAASMKRRERVEVHLSMSRLSASSEMSHRSRRTKDDGAEPLSRKASRGFAAVLTSNQIG
ncbi:MAG: hypothetical protein ACLPYS_14040 [Vulcanimicrobiaceae bacterium]